MRSICQNPRSEIFCTISRTKNTDSVYARKRPYFLVYDRILAVYMAPYYDRISPLTVYGEIRSYTEKDGVKRKVYTISVYDDRKRQRISPYMIVFRRIRSRRYTVVIRGHVNHRISPFTAVSERVSSTWEGTTECVIPNYLFLDFHFEKFF